LAEFRTLFAKYYSRVFAYLYAATLDYEYARELTLVVFLRAVEEPNVRRQPLRLFAIAREAVLDRWVVNTRIAERDVLLESASKAVLAALGNLRASERELLALRFDAGLSDAQIAALTDTPAGQVTAAITCALQELRAQLVPEHQTA
jgi:DNA-directed RNA polymerase specialized sigma24 family protein